MIRRWIILVGIMVGLPLFGAYGDEPALRLARALSEEGDHVGASVEFRRLSLSAEDPAARAAYAWSAAFEKLRAGEAERSDILLDAAEDERALPPEAIAVLRGEAALERRFPAEAAFHFQSAAQTEDDNLRSYAIRRQAVAHMRAKDFVSARRAAAAAGPDASHALNAYLADRDKSPRTGAWLGLFPGLGYAYAEEYANAARSLILNSLFIWGMVETAERDLWGAFAVITFFEITWYSGSIYGGIDASHRYNQKRLARTEAAITAGYSLQPDYEALPVLKLRYRF